MKAHIIVDEIVVNTIEVETLDFMPGLVEATEGGIGWTFKNGVFIPPKQTPIQINETQPTKAELMIKLQTIQNQINEMT